MGDGILGEKMRLDKLLALLGEGTRSEIKAMVRAGRVTVDGEIVRDEARKFDETACTVAYRRPRPYIDHGPVKCPAHAYLRRIDSVLHGHLRRDGNVGGRKTELAPDAVAAHHLASYLVYHTKNLLRNKVMKI